MRNSSFYLPVILCLFCLLHLGTQECMAQTHEEYLQIKQRFPLEPAVIQKQEQHLFLKIRDGKPFIYTENTLSFLCLSDQAKLLTRQSIPYSSFVEVSDINAKTIVPSDGKKKSIEYPVNAFNRKDVLPGEVFYSDNKMIEFDLPSIQEGAFCSYTYRETYKEPHLLTKFFFGSYLHIEKANFSVTFDTCFQLRYLLFGNNTDRVRFEKSMNPDHTITYNWTMREISKFESESSAPDISYTEPHVIISIESYNAEGKHTEVLDGLKGLYYWYYSLAAKAMEDTASVELKTIVQELCRDKFKEEDKLRAIFYWVQDNIKYIAFEYGYGGFVPRSANSICENRYGDCKDMATILYAMCREARIHCHMTWIGTRDLPYTYEENPTPFADNHMIATADVNGITYTMDATGQFLPLGMPSEMIQGKEALISYGPDSFRIYQIPVVERDKNFMTDSTFIEITADDILDGHTQRCYGGFMKYNFESSLYGANESNRKNVARALLSKGSNRFELSGNKDFSLNTSHEETLRFAYDFRIKNYVKKVGNEYFINMNLGENFRNRIIDTAMRQLDYEFDFTYKVEEVVTLQIPAGYSVAYLPERSFEMNKEYGFEAVYSKNAGQVLLRRTYYFNILKLEKIGFPSWNNWVRRFIDSNRENIVLTKSNP